MTGRARQIVFGRGNINQRNKTRAAVILITITAIVLMLSILPACGKGSIPVSPPDTQDAALYSFDVSEPEHNTRTQRLYKEYNEYFVLDAGVTAPDGLQESLYASAVKFDAERLINTLLRGQNPMLDEPTANGDLHYYVYESGSIAEYLSIEASGSCIFYRDVGFTKNIKFPTENFVTAAGYSFSNGGNPPYELVYKEQELGFMPSNKAISNVRGLLDSLGVETMPEVKVLAMDCKTMQAHQNVMKEKESDTLGFYDIKDPLTEADEFYILSFTAACNGFPLSSFAGRLSDRGVLGAEILVYYAEQGIVLFNLSGIYAPSGAAQRHETLITAEQAADAAFTHYNEIAASLLEGGYDLNEWLGGGKYVVRRAELIYAPTSCSDDCNEVVLTPAWQLTVRCSTITDRYYGEKYDICEMFTVNAVTGEII